MNDMSSVIVPKSDQMNADDLIAGPRTVRISGVDIRAGTEQPVAIHYEGDSGKPYKPCKSMCRILVTAWGPDAKKYVGRSMTLYRDPTVKWGGMEVGGIRISHMSDLDKTMVLALTATKGSRKPYTVRPLAKDALPATQDKAASSGDFPGDPPADQVQRLIDEAKIAAMDGTAAYQRFFGELSGADKRLLVDRGDHDTNKKTAAQADKPHDYGTDQSDGAQS